MPASPPGAVVFDTTPISFAVREPLPGVDLDAATPRPGHGVALWLHADDPQTLHDQLAAADVPILVTPFDGPFGRTFTFTDPRLRRHHPRPGVRHGSGRKWSSMR